MNSSLKTELEKNLSIKFDSPVYIIRFDFIGGGCINDCGKIKTNTGDFFVKWNLADAYPHMLELEAKGLQLLKEADEIHIPDVICFGSVDNISYIVLEMINAAKQQSGFWENFGISLAKLHQHSHTHFGLDHNNYIGSLPQYNNYCADWVIFFTEFRLIKQVELAVQTGKIPPSTARKFYVLYKKIPGIFPNVVPALLHGDLWSGNFIVAPDGNVSIIDPAVYYGNREAEIAFTKLFGGFSPEFYRAYDKTFPLEKGYENRLDVYNLYPLMVHVNLFGGHYLNSVESILSKYV